MQLQGELPHYHGFHRLEGKRENSQIWDVKFYPYTERDTDPVFALVVDRDVMICRPNPAGDTAFHILWHTQVPQTKDSDRDVRLFSLAWSRDMTTGDPLLCIAGEGCTLIKIFNAVTGNWVRDISGHGGDVLDLVVSPCSPEILASCSYDCQIRLWTLDLKHQKQPCAAILSGYGHTHGILTLDFHHSGNYLVSGGTDAMICIWKVPEIPNARAGTDNPEEICYPYFVSTEMHSDYVDCVKFHGDLVLSRAAGGLVGRSRRDDTSNEAFARNDILLWKIDGFPSSGRDLTPPAPVHGTHTRSAFGGGFQRLLTFELFPATPFYMRFSMFSQPGFHNVLAMGNELNKYSFWDLDRLEEGQGARDEGTPAVAGAAKRKRGVAQKVIAGNAFGRESSLGSNASSSTKSGTPSDPALAIGDPFRPIPAHRIIKVPGNVNFACRQVAWSNCGKWCVAVGDYGMTAVFKRWD